MANITMRCSVLLFVYVLALVSVVVFGGDVTHTKFHRIITIVLENQDDNNVLNDDYMWELAHKGVYLSNLDAITHPSQPNYIALTSGAVYGVDGKDTGIVVDARNVVDQLDEKGVSWKAYAQGYPGGCFTGDEGRYVRKHLPFITYKNIRNNATRCSKLESGDDFVRDYNAGVLPQYVLYIPNMDNNGHDTGVAYASRWLKSFLEPLLANAALMQDTLIVVTFDENEHYDLRNRIYTVLLGHGVKPGTLDTNDYTLYDLLRMVQDNYDLGTLGQNDAKASGKLLSAYQNAPVVKYMRPVSFNNKIVAIAVSIGSALIIALVVVIVVVVVRRRRRTAESRKTECDSSDSSEGLTVLVGNSEQV